jgi:hypothetical protein
MDSIYIANGLDFTNNGKYREYSLATQIQQAQTQSSFGGMNIPVSVSTKKTRSSIYASYNDARKTNSPVSNDWEVSDKQKTMIQYYEGNVPEYAVRYAFYKTTKNKKKKKNKHVN